MGGENKRKHNSVNKKSKYCSWTHKFVCLASTAQAKVPSFAKKEELLLAGLWEKKVVIPDVDCSTQEFHDSILETFP